MADFVQALDPAKLVLVETVSDTQLWVLVGSAFLQFLSFVTSAFDAPVYNLPLFLFGTYAQESAEAVQSSQTFTVLLGASIIYDIILKVPTALAFAAAIRQRGAQFAGLGFRGNDVQGATVWSMPGGFTSGGAREGYQSVDEPAEVQVAPPKHSAPPPQPAVQPTPGAYQSV
ncbi:hypothetical protein EIP86_002882 [Pleurotus ostreatoroseus]|nr:hypothetical protein EIP86_002882 [Pleurotus ostreatoroseus]